MSKHSLKQAPPARPVLNEDWLAVLIAMLFLLLSAIGLLGPHGINIVF